TTRMPRPDVHEPPAAFVRYQTEQDLRFRGHPEPEAQAPLYAGADSDETEGEAFFDDGAPLTAQDDQNYDDPPTARRRSGLITAATLIVCAMVGTAGAYGYRTYYTAPGSSKTPPVIQAESTPAKIVPASDPQSSKAIQDRVGEGSAPERVMPGAE